MYVNACAFGIKMMVADPIELELHNVGDGNWT